jgi:serine/threonine-protein kinase
VLARSGRDAEATPELRRAVFLDTRNESVHRALRDCLVRQRRWAEAYDAWKAELELSPTDHDAWYGYAELCLFLGHDDDYPSACAQLLSRFGDSADPNVCERVGRACLLSPACDDNQLRRATAAIDRALASERATPRGWLSYFQLAKALADYRAGRFAEATALVEGPAAQVPNFVPGLIDAMAQFHLGHPDLARAILAKTTAALDKAVPSKGERDVWMIQVLRRQAEDMVARPAR